MSVETSVGAGALSGAAAGTAIMPGWGTAIGAVAGGAIAYFGASESADAAGKATAANKQIVEYERQIEAQRRNAMELDYRRKSMQLMRNAQKARALALTNATSQGAGQGSGLQGGYGQIAGDTGTNALGLSQNVQIGRNIFDLNYQISGQKLALAEAGVQSQEGAAISSAGTSIMSSAGTIGKLSSGWGKPASTGLQDYSQNPYSMGYTT